MDAHQHGDFNGYRLSDGLHSAAQWAVLPTPTQHVGVPSTRVGETGGCVA